VPSKQITRDNVGRLQAAWTYPFGDTGSGPIVVRGVIYGRGRNGSLIALDAATGAERWVRERMIGMTSRGMNYWASADGRDQRLIFAMDGLLQEVDANTGKSVMSFGTNGAVDLRVGLDGRDPESIGNIQSSIPGEIFGNLVIVGSATGEGYMSPPGDIRAYDVVTGRLVWTFHTVPRPGEFGYDTWPKEAWKYVGGVNDWAEMTVDTRRGIVYIPLGSPTYDFYGADRAGSNLFGTSLVALDARTGQRRWHFQFVHHDLWDLDPSAAPQLTTIRHDGRTRDVVVASAKTPWLYVFDRDTGEPIWPIEERPVPKSDMPGEQSWPTQPYPTNPPPHARQSFGVEDISPYLPADEAARFTTRLRAAKNLGLFTPINYDDTVHIPTSNGGVLFGGMASEPATGAVYVVSHDNPGILHLLRPGERIGRSAAPQSPGTAVYQLNCQSCHGADRLGSDSMPALVYATADPANGIAAGASRFAARGFPAPPHRGWGRSRCAVSRSSSPR
jgi:quinoprotein glucose dehydrogenase